MVIQVWSWSLQSCRLRQCKRLLFQAQVPMLVGITLCCHHDYRPPGKFSYCMQEHHLTATVLQGAGLAALIGLAMGQRTTLPSSASSRASLTWLSRSQLATQSAMLQSTQLSGKLTLAWSSAECIRASYSLRVWHIRRAQANQLVGAKERCQNCTWSAANNSGHWCTCLWLMIFPTSS